MIGLIVSGHINFASGMSAVKAIAGEQENMVFIDFVGNPFSRRIGTTTNASSNECRMCEQILFLTDLPGGTPCNRAMAIMMEDKSVEVLAGVNLPMIVNAALEREGVDAKNFFLSYTYWHK
ncbi:PTS mannose transporter subunit IIA [Providencia huaxiensis]|uniref:PTS sugar transporter subunit IIA domain-containing protein n=1 Tax=Providencia huaxiensis TaxID=2027290 RepID=UPI0034DD5C5E